MKNITKVFSFILALLISLPAASMYLCASAVSQNAKYSRGFSTKAFRKTECLCGLDYELLKVKPHKKLRYAFMQYQTTLSEAQAAVENLSASPQLEELSENMKQSCPTLEQCCHNKIRWRNAKNFVQLGICGTLMYFDKSGYGACLLALPALKPIFNEKNNAEEKALACYVEAQNERLAKLIKLAAEKDLRIKE